MSRTKGFMYIVIAYVIWGSLGVIIRFADIPSWVLFMIGSLSSLGILMIYFAFTGKLKTFFSTKYSTWVYIYPIFQTFTGLCGYLALSDKNVLTSASMLVFNSAPLLVVFLTPLIIGEKSTKNEVKLAGLGFIGLLVFVLFPMLFVESKGTVFSYGMIYAVVGLVFNSISSIINRKISQEVTTEFIPAIITLGNVLIILPFFLLTGGNFAQISLVSYTVAIAVGIFSSIIAFLFLCGGYKVVKVQEAMIIGLFQPVYIAVVGYLFLDEKLSWTMLPGALIILLSSLLLIRESTKVDVLK